MATRRRTNKTTRAATGQSKEVPDGQRIFTLALGDALVFLIFAAIGRGSHGETTGLAALPDIAVTAAPFAIGWFLVAPFVGAFRRDLMAAPRKMVTRTTLAWLLTWPVGLLLRWLFVGRIPPLTFALITFTFVEVVLLVWRWPYAVNNSMKRRA